MTTVQDHSSRFRKAAITERDRLVRQREKVESRLDRLQVELVEVEEQRDRLNSRIDALRELTGDTDAGMTLRTVRASQDSTILKGANIRATAVRILIESGRARGSIHYREWLNLLQQQGFAITGKRPDAVFLNQIVRSPVVKTTTTAGVYEIDWAAEERLVRRLDQLKAELREATVQDSLDTPQMELLALERRRVERSLDEARDVLQVRQEAAA
jgi:hypothetical protein